MEVNKNMLAQTMAFLLSIPPESNLAKLLKLCLVARYNPESLGKTPLEKTHELIRHPFDLPYWIQEVIQSDEKITPEEWQAFGELNLKQTQDFINTLWQELDDLRL
ncbi:MAG: hypothetical protein RMY16_17590 [Nostoc sp. DedQUE12b]|uniref:hypothetical protein n=1 Tax=Nostoc sp. DedQUE12b TaxID=3075398 RepID=UPI002AD52BB4|nr:hypothetical protein [Nostoc sp. DedQUE12b]MDZ8087350.1 hypothetical protein [Nostoc sp. DedQUE12b]